MLSTCCQTTATRSSFRRFS